MSIESPSIVFEVDPLTIGMPGFGQAVVKEVYSFFDEPEEFAPHIDTTSPNKDNCGLPIAALKANANDGNGGVVDSLVLDVQADSVARMIKRYAGKKDRTLQDELTTAIEHLAAFPETEGTEKIKGMRGNEPTYGFKKVQLRKFKPMEVPALSLSRKVNSTRIIYALVDSLEFGQTIGIHDIIDRGDFTKKYR